MPCRLLLLDSCVGGGVVGGHINMSLQYMCNTKVK